MTAAVIQAERLGKRYRLGEGTHSTLRDRLHDRGRGGSRKEIQEVWALRDLDLEIGAGEVVGIVGRNGAGKTTFLKTVARIVRPTLGVVRVRGRVGALLEVGTGFHPELTGRENVFLNGVVLGMTRREVARRFDEIVSFAGVEGFLETPLKRYSSGMYLRLAFAVAAHIEPDVVIVDEVLAVGDAEFQRRCLGRMSEFGQEGRTVLFVSHDTGAVGRLCKRAIWLEHGRVRGDGAAHDILDAYLRLTVPTVARVDVPTQGGSLIADLSVGLKANGEELLEAPRRDQPLTLALTFTALEPVRGLDAAFFVKDRNGTRIVNENLSDAEPTITGPAQRYSIQLTVPPLLAAGDYVVGVWIGSNDALGFRGEVLRMTILPLPDDREESVHGTVRPNVRWQVDAK